MLQFLAMSTLNSKHGSFLLLKIMKIPTKRGTHLNVLSCPSKEKRE